MHKINFFSCAAITIRPENVIESTSHKKSSGHKSETQNYDKNNIGIFARVCEESFLLQMIFSLFFSPFCVFHGWWSYRSPRFCLVLFLFVYRAQLRDNENGAKEFTIYLKMRTSTKCISAFEMFTMRCARLNWTSFWHDATHLVDNEFTGFQKIFSGLPRACTFMGTMKRFNCAQQSDFHVSAKIAAWTLRPINKLRTHNSKKT